MRLTAELIKHSLSYPNALHERELNLRVDTKFFKGHKIPNVENLGAVSQDTETIDFTDNDISVLGNFPLLPRLKSLLCARNRIHTISPSLVNNAPHLTTIVLMGNNLKELGDLDPLQGFPRLTYLSITGNPACMKENYRYWVIWRCPSVRFLDYQKVKDTERRTARELFGSKDEPTPLARSLTAVRTTNPNAISSTPAINEADGPADFKLTDTERQRFQAMIQKAKSLDEVTKLEAMFARGKLPVGVMDGHTADGT